MEIKRLKSNVVFSLQCRPEQKRAEEKSTSWRSDVFVWRLCLAQNVLTAGCSVHRFRLVLRFSTLLSIFWDMYLASLKGSCDGADLSCVFNHLIVTGKNTISFKDGTKSIADRPVVFVLWWSKDTPRRSLDQRSSQFWTMFSLTMLDCFPWQCWTMFSLTMLDCFPWQWRTMFSPTMLDCFPLQWKTMFSLTTWQC